jgi:hypothetical protein
LDGSQIGAKAARFGFDFEKPADQIPIFPFQAADADEGPDRQEDKYREEEKYQQDNECFHGWGGPRVISDPVPADWQASHRVWLAAGDLPVRHGRMSLTVWANHELRPGARELFYDSLARLGCRLLQAENSSRSVLTQGEPDPTLAGADIAYGQPAPEDVLRSPKLRWVALSTAGYTRYDNAAFRAAVREKGVVMTNTSQVFAGPCAEHMLAPSTCSLRCSRSRASSRNTS